MKRKKILKWFIILLGVMMMYLNLGTVQASEITSVFTGETISRDTIQTRTVTYDTTRAIVPVTVKLSKTENYRTNPSTAGENFNYWVLSSDNGDALYCLNIEKGFESDDNIVEVGKTDSYTYKNQYTLNNISSSNEAFLTTDGGKRKAILWILNHCATQEDMSTLLEAASVKVQGLGKDYIKNDMKNNNDDLTKITFEEIKIIQQIAIWHYTNTGNRFDNSIYGIQAKQPDGTWSQISALNQKNIDTDNLGGYGTLIWNGDIKQRKLNAIYDYLIEGAQDAAENGYEAGTTLTLSKGENIAATEKNGKYIIGPFKLEGTNIDAIKEITANISDYKILDSSKKALAEQNFKNVIGKDFYLEVADKNIDLTLTYTYDGKSLTFLTDDDNIDNTQPLVLIGNAGGKDSTSVEFESKVKELSVTKVWADSNNADGLRPSKVTVQLYNGSNIEGNPIELKESNGWKYTWNDLDEESNYKVKELDSTGKPIEDGGKYNEYYTTSYKVNAENITIITNSHSSSNIDVFGKKVWSDKSDQDGKRPASVTINLLANGEKIKDTITTKSKNWEFSFTNLPEIIDGEKVEYTVSENPVSEYSVKITGDVANGFTITNTYTPGVLEKTVRKVWKDNDNQDGKRAEYGVTLKANGETYGREIKLNPERTEYTWTNLPKYKDGKEVKYTVEETTVPEGYRVEYSDETFTITNKYTPETINVTGRKIWEDNNNQDGKRPEIIIINLFADGTLVDSKAVKEDIKGNWVYSFMGVPKYNQGKEIVYTITEEPVENYETTIKGFDVTNKYIPEKIEINGTKTWIDYDNKENTRPTSITVNLLADGTRVTSKTVKANEDGTWTYKFTDLPKYNQGKEIEYTVTENPVGGYTTTIEGFDIVNTFETKTKVRGTKTWIDYDNKENTRPESITVNLLKDGEEIQEKIVTADSNWSYVFEDLEKYNENNELIQYTITEDPVENYSTKINGYNIINTYVAKTSISGTKTWVDNNNQDGKRPNSITVNLLANGEKVKEIIVESNDSNQWDFTVENLNKYDENNNLIEYTISENPVEGYTTTVEGFNIINNYTPGKVRKTVVKKWVDNDNSDNLRPETIQVQLYKNGTAEGRYITLSEENNWTYTWNNLDEKANGEKIIYWVQEITEVEGYKTTYSAENYEKTNKITITNTHIPKDFDIELQKVDAEGNLITSTEAKFDITGAQTLNSEIEQGILDLDSQKVIGDEFEYIYIVKEEKAPIGYNKISEELSVKISGTTKFENGAYIIDEISFTDKNGANLDNTKISAEYDEELNKVIIKVVNNPIANEYFVRLLKVKEDGTTAIEGAWFKVQNGQPIQVSKDGNEIDKGTLNNTNELNLSYVIEEITAPSGYIKIDGQKEVKIKATVELKDNEYQLTEVNLLEEIEGISISEENNVITIKAKNEPIIIGKYNVILRKVDENGDILRGSKFKINNTEYDLSSSEQVTILENTDILSTDDIILTYNLKETVVPNGYVGINDTAIRIKAIVKNENNKYRILRTELVNEDGNTITDENISIKLEGNSIVIVVKNTPIEQPPIEEKEFDLSLRKFITKVNDEIYSREPVVDTSKLGTIVDGKTITTATYKHSKQPITVRKGDVVTYTIRVYNEGELDGYVEKITDHLPAHLLPIIAGVEGIEEEKYAEEIEFNLDWGWIVSEDGKSVVTTKTSKENTNKYSSINGCEDITDTKLEAFVPGSSSLDYIDVQIKCLVRDSAISGEYLTNIAEITEAKDINGKKWDGSDSKLANANTSNLSDYKNTEALGSNKESYIPGKEDDDDFEKLVINEFDLSLRKFITKVNETTYSREPVVDTSKLGTVVDGKTVTTAIYKHSKQPIVVQKGDVVTYTIRVYNEGELDGYVEKITDHLQDHLLPIIAGTEGIDEEKYAEEIEFNLDWGWIVSEDGKSVITTKTSKVSSETYSLTEGYENVTDTKLEAYVPGSNNLDYIDVQIKCLVTDSAISGEYLTNIAEITEAKDINGKSWDGSDSELANANTSDLSNYKNTEALRSNDLSYIPGQEDDDDFEKLVVKEFDLALRKFITKVNETTYSREPKVDTSKLRTSVNEKTITTATYVHSKQPVIVETSDVVTYIIRVYNEGSIAGFANEITDNIPEGLEFMPNSDVNVSYRWTMLDKDGKETEDVTKAVMIKTDYLSDRDSNNIIREVTENEGTKTLSYKDVEVQFKVIAKAEKLKDNIIINEAQISADSDRDIDSIPNRDEKYDYATGKNEDDIDYEPIKLQYFDLALRKFITKVNSTDYNNRYPEVIYNEDGSIKYNHTKDPVLVTTGDIVTYTIRVYNEGEKAGYATQIIDNLPDGLEFLPENDTNKKFGWKLLDNQGNVTEDITKAQKATTNILEKEIINALVQEGEQRVLTYKDVQIAFKVIEPTTSDRILVNTAQIAADSDNDIDSIPNNNIEAEDDLDKEYVRVEYFDLSLKKWVTATKVTLNGKTTTTKTGFTEESEGIAKVDIVASKIKNTTVKFVYNIKVTNEGERPGYAYEVKDYIPSGLKFVASDNKDWKEEKDGAVVTEKLKDTLLKPGESATVEIVLTWKNSSTNLGIKTNYAEISKDSADDIDSTPNNNNLKEDDIDDAQVILSIKTAGTTTYIGFVLISVALLAGGIFSIKKYVLDK